MGSEQTSQRDGRKNKRKGEKSEKGMKGCVLEGKQTGRHKGGSKNKEHIYYFNITRTVCQRGRSPQTTYAVLWFGKHI